MMRWVHILLSSLLFLVGCTAYHMLFKGEAFYDVPWPGILQSLLLMIISIVIGILIRRKVDSR